MIDQILPLAESSHVEETLLKEIVSTLKEGQQELSTLKEILYSEGLKIIDVMQNEMERKIAEQTLSVFSAMITFVSALLFLSFSQYQTAAYVLSLTSSGLSMATIVLSKAISYKFFQHTEKFSALLREKHKGFDAANSSETSFAEY